MGKDQLVLFAALLGGIAIFTLVLGSGRYLTSKHQRVLNRLRDLEDRRHVIDQSLLISQQQQGFVSSALEQMTKDTSFALRLEEKLTNADVRLTVGEYLVIVSLSMALSILLGIWLKNIFLSITLLLAAYYGPLQWLESRQQHRLQLFETQLPEMLTMLANTMRTLSVLEYALAAIATEVPAPMSTELSRVVAVIQKANMQPIEALQRMANRIHSKDMHLMVVTLSIQSKSGEDPTSILNQLSSTIKERAKLQAEIKSLTAQQQYSGYLMALLPVVFLMILLVFNPNYILGVFQKTVWCGWTMYSVAAVMIFVGLVVMRNLTRLRV